MIRLPGICCVRRATVKNSQIATQRESYHEMLRCSEARYGFLRRPAPQRLFVIVVVVVLVAKFFVVVRVDVADTPAAAAGTILVVVIVVPGAGDCGMSTS